MINNTFFIICTSSFVKAKKFAELNNIKKKNYCYFKKQNNNTNVLIPNYYNNRYKNLYKKLIKLKFNFIYFVESDNHFLMNKNFKNYKFTRSYFNFFHYSFNDYPIFTNAKVNETINNNFLFIYGKKKKYLQVI